MAVISAATPPRQSTTVPKTSKASTLRPDRAPRSKTLALRQLQVGTIDRLIGVSQDVQEPRIHRHEHAIEVGPGLLQGSGPRVSIRGHSDAAPALVLSD